MIALLPVGWRWILPAAGLAILTYCSYRHGLQTGTDATRAVYEERLAERDKAASAAMARAMEDAQARTDAAMAVERRSLAAQATADARFAALSRSISNYAKKAPVLASCGLDSDGLRLWNAANSGGDDASASYP